MFCDCPACSSTLGGASFGRIPCVKGKSDRVLLAWIDHCQAGASYSLGTFYSYYMYNLVCIERAIHLRCHASEHAHVMPHQLNEQPDIGRNLTWSCWSSR
jgi:hypothetical protein